MRRKFQKLGKKNNNPMKNTIEIISIYVVLGVTWILISDEILNVFSSNHEFHEFLQTIKGILFVIFTAFLFYFIIKRRMDLYADTIDDLGDAVTQLENSNTALKKLEKVLYDKAYYDDLTNVYSRAKILEDVTDFIEENENELLAFVDIDIDNFKELNETKGHDIGDVLIQQVAIELKRVIGEDNIIGRLSGDEFIVLIKSKASKQELIECINNISKNIKKTYFLDREDFYASLSAGVAIYPYDGEDYHELLKCADIALNEAKLLGKNQIVFYSEKLADVKKNQAEIANQLYYGVKNQEFLVYYQPIISNKNLKATMVEALIRWNHPMKGLVPPLDFIYIAEKTGHIKEMTWFVIKEAFKQQLKWKSQGLNIQISINLSAKILSSHTFVPKLTDMVKEMNVETKQFIFEVTESMIIDNLEDTIKTLMKLRKIGFKIALDDFGVGYSSLTYLQKLPLDYLKIDRSFIKEISDKEKSSPVLQFMIDLAHKLELYVISEGVETEDALQLLKDLKSDYFQGYYFSKPLPEKELDQHIFR